MNRTPTSANYDFWIKNKRNVLFTGKHGIGKTETVKEKFQEHFGDNWLYLSASTLDPWVDFVGVPKEVIDPKTGESFLDLVRPKIFQNDTVRAIMIDEYNRAAPKVRNAVMEILQFKSINGKKQHNLEIVWAAINPDDDDSYDVEKLDPAQRDRFHIHVNLPYAVSREYFNRTYGPIGNTACDWWDKLDEELQNKISPRRLSYVLNEFNVNGDLSYVLPPEANIKELVNQLTDGSFVERLKALYLNKDEVAIREAFTSENFCFGTETIIIENDDYRNYFIPFLPKEKIAKLYLSNEKVRTRFMKHEDYRKYQDIFDPIINDKHSTNSTKIEFSIKSGLKRWRGRFIPADELSNIDFIDIVADHRHNITYLTDEHKQRDVINRFGIIMDNGVILDQKYYDMMFAIMCELLERTDSELHPYILANIKTIKQIRKQNHMVKLSDIFNQDLYGLRKIKNSTESFNKITEILKKESII